MLLSTLKEKDATYPSPQQLIFELKDVLTPKIRALRLLAKFISDCRETRVSQSVQKTRGKEDD
jgi:hypothetical protein